MVATGSILAGLGRVLEPSQRDLSMIFDVSKHASQTCSSCNKTTVLAMFYKLRNMPHMSTKHVFSIAFKAFLDMAHGLLQKPLAGIHFLLFKPTLQRSGTREAHGIGTKLGMLGSKKLQRCFFFILFIEMSLKITSWRALDSILEALGPRFGWVWISFFEPPASFFKVWGVLN